MSSTLKLFRSVFLLLAMCTFSIRWGHLFASPLMTGNCSDVCDSSSDCDEGCLVNLDGESSCGEYGVCYASECGNVCDNNVNCDTQCCDGGDTTCGGDSSACFYCGDGLCNSPTENCDNCEADCGGACPSECNEGDPSCVVNSDCPFENQFCDNGCCINPCSGTCDGGRTRSCSNENELCDNSGQCCSDEMCAGVDGGQGQCYQKELNHSPAPSSMREH